jgi:hypothetical protein
MIFDLEAILTPNYQLLSSNSHPLFSLTNHIMNHLPMYIR